MLRKSIVVSSICLIIIVLLSCMVFEHKEYRSNNISKISYSEYAVNYEMEYKIVNGSLYGKGKNNLCLFGDDKYKFYDDWVKIVDTKNIIHIEAMNGTIIYLTDMGEVYGLGNSEGIFDTEELILSPKLIFNDCKYVSIGIKFALFIKNDDSLWFIGESKNGQSTKMQDNIYSPIQIEKDIAFAKAFGYTSVWLGKDKSLYLCGDNSYGQIGNGSQGSGFPTLYQDIVLTPYVAIENCLDFLIVNEKSIEATTDDGATYIWGGEYGNKPRLKK